MAYLALFLASWLSSSHAVLRFSPTFSTYALPTGVNLSVLLAGAPLAPATPAILFLHGFPEGSWSWASTFATGALDSFSLIAPDMRGYNHSSIPAHGGYVLPTLVADVAALAAAVAPGSRVHLVAHDWGGIVAWAFAAAHPEVLQSLTILNCAHPMGWIAGVRTDPAQQAASSYVLSFVNPAFSMVATADGDALLKGIFAGESWWTPDVEAAFVASWAVPGSVDAALQYYRENIVPACPLSCTVASCWRAGATSSFDALANNGVLPPQLRVLVLWGMRDTAFDGPWQLNYITTKVRGDLKVTRFNTSNHWLAQEQPEAVAAAVAAWVNSA
jgi:pimeloyl-ACP methyl ester carboxylesterase